MNAPLISIIIPIYNGEKQIDKCLSNVVAQTYKNLEILCVINGTTDSSEEKVREWMQKDERIRILVTDVADLGHTCHLSTWMTGLNLNILKSCMEVSKKVIRFARAIAPCMMVQKTYLLIKEEVRVRYPFVELPSYCHVEQFQFTTGHYLRN